MQTETAKLSASSIRKLRAVKAAILAEPELYDQANFPSAKCGDNCQTPCCFAGWAVWLNNPDPIAYDKLLKEKKFFGVAALKEALSLTSNQADTLFRDWNPETKSSIRNAREGAERIDIFIHSGGLK